MPINDPQLIRTTLEQPRRIALVGASDNPGRAANGVMRFLIDQGHDVVGVNPRLAGQTIHGAPVVASLSDVHPPAHMVDIFRDAEAAAGVVDEAIAHGASVVWMQLGVIAPEAAGRAEAAGLGVVMDRCPKIEAARLGLGPVGAR